MKGDLTSGKPIKVITLFALPMLAGNFFQQLYSMADSIILGNYVGSDALAAVGASFAVNFFLISIAIGLTIGCSVAISQLFGAGRLDEMRRACFTALVFLAAAAVVLSIIFYLLTDWFLELLNTPANIKGQASLYLHILFSGVLFTLIYNASAALIRAVGDSRTPLIFLIFASLLNIGLDLVFVIHFRLGIAGVAAATLTSQGLAAVLCLIFTQRKRSVLRFSRRDIVFDWQLLGKMLGYGVPATLQQLMVCCSLMIVQGLVNSFGSAAVAGFSISNRVEMLIMMPVMNLGMAYSTYTAQNIGAEDLPRVTQGLRAVLLLSIGVSLAVGALVFLFRVPLVRLFLQPGAPAEITDFATTALGVLASLYFTNAVMHSMNGLLRGAGDMRAFTVISLITLISRLLFAYLAAPFMGYASVWWSNPVSWTIGGAAAYGRYRQGRWKAAASRVWGSLAGPKKIGEK